MYQIWLLATKKITTVKEIDFILQQGRKHGRGETCKDSKVDEDNDQVEKEDDNKTQETAIDRNEATKKPRPKPQVSFEKDTQADEMKSRNYDTKRSNSVKCVIIAKGRRRETDALMDRVTIRKRKEIIADATGTNKFVMVALEMLTNKANTTRFADTTGGDIENEFEETRRKYLQTTALKIKISKSRATVIQRFMAPRNRNEESTRPNGKEWAQAHGTELERHEKALRTWVCEEALLSDITVSFTMTYKAKYNQLRGTDKYKARCAILYGTMKPGKQLD